MGYMFCAVGKKYFDLCVQFLARGLYMYIDASKTKKRGRVRLDSVSSVTMEEIENTGSGIPKIDNGFYERYDPEIRTIVAKILYHSNQESYIEDCVNDVYLRLIENLQQYNETRGSMAAFVAIIARSTALNHCRGNRRRPNELVGDEKIDVLSDPINVEDEIGFKVLVEDITKKLKKEERILFAMRYIYYFAPEEIAKEFHISVGTAYKRINRLKNKVKKYLTEEGIVL